MTGTAQTLKDLLEGDFVRLELADRSIRAEVVGVDREVVKGPSGDRARRCTIRFMPVGTDAKAAEADRYRVTVEPSNGGFRIGSLIAEIYVEEKLDYRSEPRGELVGVSLVDGI